MQMTNSYIGRCLGTLLVAVWFTLGFTSPGQADQAKKVAVDAAGNVYVTGSSSNGDNADYVTIKYSPSGAWLWGRRYNGPANGNDVPNALVLDAAGNIYVTGLSSNGVNSDYVTIKYSPAGDWVWGRRYNGPANDDDSAEDLAVDAAGNVYVTGSSSNGVNNDYVTIKYSPGGAWVWGRRYNGLANGDDEVRSMAVDASGNVHVTGVSWNATNKDYVTIKYASNGAWLWGCRYNGTGNSSDYPAALKLDSMGNVCVAGTSKGAGTDYDYVTIKYSSSGLWLWGRRYHGIILQEICWDLEVDSSNNVYVTGWSHRILYTNVDIVTIKYDAAGNWVWGHRYYDANWSPDLEVDSLGNAFVTGGSYNGDNYDYVTMKYGVAGNLLWDEIYNGTANGEDRPADLALDSGGNLYVTGVSWNEVNSDFVTIKYSHTGAWLWGARYDGPD